MDANVPTLVLVRHGRPAIEPDVAPPAWRLSPDGIPAVRQLAARLAEHSTAVAVSSPQPKALETATLLGLDDVASDPRRCEVDQPSQWNPRHAETALSYLAGEAIAGWEPAADVVRRCRQAVSEVPAGTIVVGHGLSLSLLVSSYFPVDPKVYWSELGMPDAWLTGTSGLRRL